MRTRCTIVLGFIFFSLICWQGESIAQRKYGDFKREASLQSASPVFIQQGFSMKLWMSNDGQFGYPYPQGVGIYLEYPNGSGIEHLWTTNLKIGAIVDDSASQDSPKRYIAVTQTGNGHIGRSETTPIDTTFVQQITGIDSGALSENDLISTCTDTVGRPDYWYHRPLGIKIIQRSLAWQRKIIEPILPIEYTIVNIGKNTLRDVAISFYLDADVGPINSTSYYYNNYAGYLDSLRMLYFHNPIDEGSTPVGL